MSESFGDKLFQVDFFLRAFAISSNAFYWLVRYSPCEFCHEVGYLLVRSTGDSLGSLKDKLLLGALRHFGMRAD